MLYNFFCCLSCNITNALPIQTSYQFSLGRIFINNGSDIKKRIFIFRSFRVIVFFLSVGQPIEVFFVSAHYFTSLLVFIKIIIILSFILSGVLMCMRSCGIEERSKDILFIHCSLLPSFFLLSLLLGKIFFGG